MVITPELVRGEVDEPVSIISSVVYMTSDGFAERSVKNPHQRWSLLRQQSRNKGSTSSQTSIHCSKKNESSKESESNKKRKAYECKGTGEGRVRKSLKEDQNIKRDRQEKTKSMVLSEKKLLALSGTCMENSEQKPHQDTVKYLKTLSNPEIQKIQQSSNPEKSVCNGPICDVTDGSVCSQTVSGPTEFEKINGKDNMLKLKEKKQQENQLKAKLTTGDQCIMFEKVKQKKVEKQEISDVMEKMDSGKEKQDADHEQAVDESKTNDHDKKENKSMESKEFDLEILRHDIEQRRQQERERDKEEQRQKMAEISRLVKNANIAKNRKEKSDKEELVVNLEQKPEMSKEITCFDDKEVDQEEEDNKLRDQRQHTPDREETDLKRMMDPQLFDKPEQLNMSEKKDMPEKILEAVIREAEEYDDGATENTCSFDSLRSMDSYSSCLEKSGLYSLESGPTSYTAYKHESKEHVKFYFCTVGNKDTAFEKSDYNESMNMMRMKKKMFDEEADTNDSEEKYQGEEKKVMSEGDAEIDSGNTDLDLRNQETSEDKQDTGADLSETDSELDKAIMDLGSLQTEKLNGPSGTDKKIKGPGVCRRIPDNDWLRSQLVIMEVELKKKEDGISVADERHSNQLKKLNFLCQQLSKELFPQQLLCKYPSRPKGQKSVKRKNRVGNKDFMVPKIKRPEVPKPNMPQHTGTDIYVPETDKNQRKLKILLVQLSGRRCSSSENSSGGQSGGDSSGSNRGGSKKSDNNNNSNNNSNNNNSNNSENKDGEDNVHRRGGGGESQGPTRTSTDTNIPKSDYKGYRKKHPQMCDLDWAEFLGLLSIKTKENNGPIWKIQHSHVSVCLSACLAEPAESSDEMLACNVCRTINSLLKHYADCPTTYNNCSMCLQIFSLICSHVYGCINNSPSDGYNCQIQLCVSISSIISGREISLYLQTLWFDIRAKLARIMGGATISLEFAQPVPLPNSPQLPPKRPSRVSVANPSLQSIPEDTPLVVAPNSRSGSRVLARKKSNLTDVDEQPTPIESPRGEVFLDEVSQVLIGSEQLTVHPESDALPISLELGEDPPSGGSESSFGIIIRDYAPDARHVSMPMGPPRHHGDAYFPSFSDTPTGVKGIGEVVYANKKQLVKVASVWDSLKTQYRLESTLARHYREEGVILAEFKHNLKIQGLRYNNEFQWVKVAHLGNGMSGKCHLATDFESEFKFCVKEIHISNYEKEEIELWCELEHPYIVQIYGAIRHGEKLYILMEFVAGGCLTEVINIQKELRHRLSQTTALRYFEQLLQVLSYLRSKRILHEDLKADNILLNKGKGAVSIKVTDFGLSRRCQGTVPKGTKPVGTQTQWSPEKAEGVGYGFPAEVWAAVCVLVHMLSGLPPWLRRYETIKSLIVVIVEKSPPVEDIPKNIQEPVRDLIERGFTVCPGQRPLAEKMLLHRAFQLIQGENLASGLYSVLPSFGCSSTNQIEDDPNADLREIIKNLKNPDLKVSEKVQIQPISTYDVYAVMHGGTEKGSTASPQAVNHAGDSTLHQQEQFQESTAGVVSNPSTNPLENTDPYQHYLQFIVDEPFSNTQPRPQPTTLTLYQPNTQGEGKVDSGRTSSRIDEEVTEGVLPVFQKLGISDTFTSSDVLSDEEDEERDNPLKDFDLDAAIKTLDLTPKVNNHIPNIINSGESRSRSGSEEKTIRPSTAPISMMSTYPSSEVVINDDDDLFRSGSPKKEMEFIPMQFTTSMVVPLSTPTANLLKNWTATTYATGLAPTQKKQTPNTTPVSNTGLDVHQNLAKGHTRNLDSQQQFLHNSANTYDRTPPRQNQFHNSRIPGVRSQPNIEGLGSPYLQRPWSTPGSRADISPKIGPEMKRQKKCLDGNVTPLRRPPSDVTGSAATVKPPRQNVKERIDARNRILKTSISNNEPLQASPKTLHLDLKKAQGPSTLPVTQAQTAPVFSPPKTTFRQNSFNTPASKISSTSTPSPKNEKSSTPSRSLYDEQEDALRELERTAEDELSQHSDNPNRFTYLDEPHDLEGNVPGEMDFDIENPEMSLAHYLDPPDEASITVVFKSKTNGREFKMKFSIKSSDWTWYRIIDDELSRYPDMNKDFGLDQFSLKFEDGTLIDLDSQLGKESLTVYVDNAADSWWVESGRIMHI